MPALPAFKSLKKAGAHPALALNADFRPLSILPLSVWSWQDTVHSLVRERVTVVAEHDEFVHWPSGRMRYPSVVAVRDYVPHRPAPAFTRQNVLLRDRHACAYCGHKFATDLLTFDHVIPKSRGGRTDWTNIVMACGPDNFRKANRTPQEAGMQLLWRPWKPTAEELARAEQHFDTRQLHNGWADFLFWDTPLEA